MHKIELNSHYMIKLDSDNATLYKKGSGKYSQLDDDDNEVGYVVIGYFDPYHPEILMKYILMHNIVMEKSKEFITMQEYVKLFTKSVTKLVNKLNIVEKMDLHEEISRLNLEIKKLNRDKTTLKSQCTRQKNKNIKNKPRAKYDK